MAKYTEEELQEAIKDHTTNGLSSEEAGQKWNVPPSTIRRRVKKGIMPKGHYQAYV